MKKITLLMVLFLIGCQTNSPTELSLINLFNDHMVLQQDTLVSFWGQATKGVKVSLHSSWGAQATTVADETGNWMVQLNTPKADNKSHTVTVKSKKNTIKIEDVLMGEVWLASGQSNMEMPMKGFRYAKVHELVEGAEEEIANANYPEIRMFTVKRTIAFEPQENIEGNWAVCTPETLGEFSAVAYYFGKKLYQELNVPIGLIHSSWGGSPAESWVRLDLIEKIKGFENTSKRLEIANDPNTPYNKWVAKHTSVKWDSLIEVDNFKWVDKTHLEFLSSDYNDDAWQDAAVTSIGEAFEKDDFNGIGWIRQQLNIDSLPEGDLVFDLGETDDLYTIFINGEMIGRKEYWGVASNRYTFSSDVLKKGQNTIAIRFIDVWGEGGLNVDRNRGIYVGDKKIIALNEDWKLNMVCYLTGGDFYILESGDEEIALASPDRMPHQSNSPTTLNNGMIAPLVPYTLKGFIWYQGESNQGRAEEYKTLFPAVIDSWRAQWKNEALPFYYVQIAPFAGYGLRTDAAERMTSAELRESQMLTLAKSNVGMAITTDVGDDKLIHPPKKKEVGDRLALWALNKDYGYTDLVHSGPIYKSVRFNKGRALVSFDHAGSGLYCPDNTIKHFEIAGADGKYYPAKARIIGKEVMVWSNKVPQPKGVRLGWENYFEINLFNKEGLPASSFRSME
jgi:sialate O-acetylesterase